jgi:hypothetical protein
MGQINWWYPEKNLSKKQRKEEARQKKKDLLKRIASIRSWGVFYLDNGRGGHQARARKLEKDREQLEQAYNEVKDIPKEDLTSEQRRIIMQWKEWFRR